MVDYVSLFKTRVVIRILGRHTLWSPLVCIADFAFGFMIYVVGVTILPPLPILLRSEWIRPPAVSFGMAMVFMFIIVWWVRIFVPDIEAKAITLGAPVDQIAALLHGDVPQTVLGMAFMIQLIPFVTIGSDLFYASIMPSIWLWLFVTSVFVAKVVSGIGAYLQFALMRFRKRKCTLAVTGTLLIPIIIMRVYVAMLLPYVLVGHGFLAEAVVGATGLLADHLPTPPTP
ncbi:hypothetical protein MKK75_29955 [Methylobacterium sp. J-030]|uniref:hypothetical protein n=1 Tax=Methylobacterium sp. J-030 TaxID=2836627 RepID=UPI001FBC0DC5|nr:hypothetical protein [Methylobacterium sp. J-030]MCJ2072970.1 hypothetical protein [Methylobacterium sp. J-030]